MPLIDQQSVPPENPFHSTCKIHFICRIESPKSTEYKDNFQKYTNSKKYKQHPLLFSFIRRLYFPIHSPLIPILPSLFPAITSNQKMLFVCYPEFYPSNSCITVCWTASIRQSIFLQRRQLCLYLFRNLFQANSRHGQHHYKIRKNIPSLSFPDHME